jgi:bifunctional DNA-binding transcriptional regulator/antitoxin component of YhaV-PrlF toxin-antitoxin module
MYNEHVSIKYQITLPEPLADEMDLRTALQRGSTARATEEKYVAAAYLGESAVHEAVIE